MISKIRHNPKELRNFIRSVIPSKHLTSPPNILDINRISVEDQTLISQFFNNYFVKMDEQLQKIWIPQSIKILKLILEIQSPINIILNPPQPNEIYNIINSLNLHKATGCCRTNISA